MRILFLGYQENETTLIDFLKKRNHEVSWSISKKFTPENFDLIISFGYRHIIEPDVIQNLSRPIINLHISYLPFNRGTHPNFWSHFENTPCGVTIHEIDEGVDTGKIIYRKQVKFCDSQTLRQSYRILLNTIESLFKKNIVEIEKFTYKTLQIGETGTYHNTYDLPEWVNWDLTIKDVKERNE